MSDLRPDDQRDDYQGPVSRTPALLERVQNMFAGAESLSARMTPIPLLLFLGLSWFSTTAGLGGIIKASRGDVGLMWIPIGIFVFAATYMMQHFLEQLFQPVSLFRRSTAFIAYAMLMGFSVSFGFGFYWNLLEARRQTFEVAREAVGAATTNIQLARTSLERMESSVAALRDRSAELSEREASEGGTCGDRSPPGEGPRHDFRNAEAQVYERDYRVITEEQARISNQIEALATDLNQVEELASAGGLTDDDIRARASELFQINLRVNQFTESFNAFQSGSDLTSIRNRYDERADQYGQLNYVFEDSLSRRFRCHDPGMAAELNAVTDALDAIRPLPPVDIRSMEGAAATMEAFDRLWTSVLQLARSGFGAGGQEGVTPESEAERRARARQDLNDARRDIEEAPATGGDVVARANDFGGGLRERDLLALATAAIVDMMILIFNMYHHRTMVFQGLGRRVNELEHKKMTLPAVMERLRGLVEDPNFLILQRYQFTHMQERYLVVPVRPASQNEKMIMGLANLLMAHGVAKESAFGKTFVKRRALERLIAAREDDPEVPEDASLDHRVVKLDRSVSEQEVIEFITHPPGGGEPIDL